MKEAILSAKDLKKVYARGNETETVLRGVNLEIFAGDFTVIMGPSGSGKSTLLYALSGMDSVSSGTVRYRDQDIYSLTEKQLAALRALEFGFIFQEVCMVDYLSLFENVVTAGYLVQDRSAAETNTRAEELLTLMNVGAARDRLPASVSGGEAQRVAVARAMINSPSLIFADEPTGALNKRNSEEVLDLLSMVASQGQSILMVTHDLRAAIRGTRILYLEDGALLDEISMPPYGGTHVQEREKELTEWLVTLSW